jgi:hypothetical protein
MNPFEQLTAFAEFPARDARLMGRVLHGHFLHRFSGQLPAQELRRILTTTELLSVETGFPQLVFPLLAEERLRQAVGQNAAVRDDEAALPVCA